MVGLQQGLIAAAFEHLPDLPREVPPILNGDVHALAGLGGVGVAGIARDEDPRCQVGILLSGHIVEALGHSVADLVVAVPGHLANIDRVGVQDAVRPLDGLLSGGRHDPLAVLVVRALQGDVEPGQETSFARNEQDGAVLVRLDPASGAEVREVGVRHDVHDRPGLRCRVGVDLHIDAAAHSAACAVTSHDVLGADRALRAIRFPELDLDRVLTAVMHRQVEELEAVVDVDARRPVGGPGCEVVDHPSLVHCQDGELTDRSRRVGSPSSTSDLSGVLRMGSPKAHLPHMGGLLGDGVIELESLERLTAAGEESIRPASR